MSTNFYLINTDSETSEHIGKRSAGWAFTFQARNFKTRLAWETRIRNLGAQELIEDEYGRVIDPEEFLEVVQNSMGGRTKDGPDPKRNWVDAGCSFSNYEFS